MVPEALLEESEHGLVPAGRGWFVLNARDARWADKPGRGREAGLQGRGDFPQLGFSLAVLEPGEPMSMYHWETDQEDFLVLAGEALLVVDGEERRLRRWDFVHCPPGTNHVIIGAGDGPCIIFAVGPWRITQSAPESTAPWRGGSTGCLHGRRGGASARRRR